MKLLISMVSLLVLVGLAIPAAAQGPEIRKKKGETDREYDYRTALQAYEIGINHVHAKEMQEAIANLEKAVQMDDNNFRYHHGLALAYSLNGQLEDAVAQLKESLRINPSFSESKNLLGSIYSDLGQLDEAVEYFREVIQDKSFAQPHFAYFNLGKAKRLQGKTDEAVAAFGLASQLDPKFYRAYIALGEIYKEQKNFERMLFYYQKAEPNYQDDVNVLFNIGLAFYKLRQFERAKPYLAQVSILFPPPQIDKPTQEMLESIERLLRDRRN
jgi:tetratricopeptide (TPR) repeat protein